MAKVLNLLTLSDLHISSETLTDQQIVIEKLCDDLRVLGDSGIKPDFVLFAGDLVNDPDESDVYITFLDKFLLPILSATNLSESKCIFTPGNHDVSRRSIEKYELDNKAVFERRDEESFISKLFEARLDSEFILDRQSGFYSTLGALFGDRRSNSDPFAMHYDLPGETLTILGINTAVFSMAGVFGKEKSNLPFPDKAINEEIALIPHNHTILAVHHHPLDWLTEGAQRELSTSILDKCVVSICGHLHEAIPDTTRSPDASLVRLQLPSLFSSRKYPIGYAVIAISIPDNYIKMTFRTYYDNRRKFDKGTNVASDGVFYATENSEGYYLRVAAALTSEKVRVWVASTVGPHLRPTLDADRLIS